MGRYRTFSIDTEVDLNVFEVLEELEDDELIDELKRRKPDLSFMNFEFDAISDDEFVKKITEMIYQQNTSRIKMILQAIRESYHFPFIHEA